MSTMTDINTLIIVECYHCHTRFAMTSDLQAQRVADHKNFYCPNGHSQRYVGKTEEEKLRAELARQKQFREWDRTALQAARDQATAAEYARRAQKAANTRLKKKIAAGVCPCCKRNFQNVREHMAHQHPDFAVPKDAS